MINIHYILLNKKSTYIHTILRSMLGLIFILACIVFIKELLFPSHRFNFLAHIDSLANTISRTYVTPHGTGFDIATYGDFTHATISFSLDDAAAPLPNNTQVLAARSYKTFLSPVSTEKYTSHQTETIETEDAHYLKEDDILYPLLSENIFSSYLFNQNTIISQQDLSTLELNISEETRGFAPATLISSRDGIYVTNNNEKHPFQDEISLLALGYDFENVRSATSDERGLHKNARMFTIGSEHPFGTIFYAQDTDRMYIYDDHKLHKITSTPTAKKYAILASENSRSIFSSCTLKRNILFKKKYSCTMSLDQIKGFPGNLYQFHVTLPGVDIAKSRIILTKDVTKRSLELRLQELKKEFFKQYTQ
jgi:hypothetical protein